jgi:transposase
MKYPLRFKQAMIQRMSGPDSVTARALSEQVGIPQTTLSRWLREASVADLAPALGSGWDFSEERIMAPKRPQDWSAEDKLEVLLEASALSDEQLGGFLRIKGLHESHLKQWRSQILGALHGNGSSKSGKKKSAESKRIRQLERELARKDKALAETAALLVLKKKAQAIWGDEDDGTAPRSGK